ncbi:hypothetical protein DOTSEDRAFT_70873 [Dothistroma septosporum NZE10]|uniref:Uncharacterized protein n=1 Tax=Dothistroma septosporum (strain NZE10 / CBS 128990) TaxID=675120 RepID=N1PRC1_DOTSN|nr:hypothetical protein DOTSEDRAFT_70873 [Dothistroma septosporum NZE10]
MAAAAADTPPAAYMHPPLEHDAFAQQPGEGTIAQWTTLTRSSLPANLLSMLNPFGATTNTNIDAHDPPAPADLTGRRPVLATLPVNGPPSPSRSSGFAMFAEPDTRSNSDGGSREGSIDVLRAKKTARPKTRFSICHPPPESKARQKLHRRPRSLLQLHRLSANERPRPALEVIPSANFSVRLVRAITKVFTTKHSLCPNDLVVLKAEKYSNDEVDEEQEARDVIGLICKGRKDEEKARAGKVTIHMVSGEVWDAHQTANGGYEFSHTDEHGLVLTVRWVAKKPKDNGKGATKNGKRRFNFSTISPNSRRHPVIATLASTGLGINDTYKVPELSALTALSTPQLTAMDAEEEMDEDAGGMQHCNTDDRLRDIITMTGIWVAFKEGWSPSYRYDERDGAASVTNSPSKAGAAAVATPPGSPTPFSLDQRNSIKSIGSGIIRRTSLLTRSNRSSIASVPEIDEPETTSRNSSITKTGRSRADSSSTVLVHRAASNRRKNNQQATRRPDLDISHNPLQETSREDLSRDYVTPPRAQTQSPLANVQRTDSAPATPSSSRTPSGGNANPGIDRAVVTPPPKDSRQTSSVDRKHWENTSTADASFGHAMPAKDDLLLSPGRSKSKKSISSRLKRLLCGSKARGL